MCAVKALVIASLASGGGKRCDELADDRPTFDEMRSCVLDAFRELIESDDFREIAKATGKHVNSYQVRIANGTTIIEVEGINFGHNAMSWLARRDRDEPIYRHRYDSRVPLWTVLKAKGLEGRRAVGQLDAIRRDAALIIEHCRDVLGGDFAIFDKVPALIEENARKLRDERRKADSSKGGP